MPADYKSTLEELVVAREQAREVLKELHGVLKDCKRAKAEVVSMLQRGTAVMVLEALNEALDNAVKTASEHMDQTLSEAVQKVNQRFQEAARLLDEREEVVNDTVELVQSTANRVTLFLERHKDD